MAPCDVTPIKLPMSTLAVSWPILTNLWEVITALPIFTKPLLYKVAKVVPPSVPPINWCAIPAVVPVPLVLLYEIFEPTAVPPIIKGVLMSVVNVGDANSAIPNVLALLFFHKLVL